LHHVCNNLDVAYLACSAPIRVQLSATDIPDAAVESALRCINEYNITRVQKPSTTIDMPFTNHVLMKSIANIANRHLFDTTNLEESSAMMSMTVYSVDQSKRLHTNGSCFLAGTPSMHP
jgi:exosome complex RNA-binding protein Rrp42 (RNase PH superfamily)